MTGTYITWKPFKTPTAKNMGIDQVREEMLNELRKIGREMRNDLKGAFETWSPPKPEVEMNIHLTRSDPQAGVDVFTNEQRADWLDKGTPGHMVRAKRAKRMKWGRNYKRKTRPKSLTSTQGGHSGPVVYSKAHWVRGIDARDFSGTLAKRWERKIPVRLQAAANRGAAKAGEG